jgi:serine/threonine-protein kinase
MNGVNSAGEAATPKSCPSCGARYAADALFCSFDGAPLTTSPGAIAAAAKTDPYVGREILGHIEIRQLVGIGSMGRVYRAFQKGIDRDVAVKILHRELSANETLVARFHREAKVASRLAHPNVVHVLLTGQLPDGALYIVMEYLDGLSLQSALAATGGAMPLPRALHIVLELCDAAGEAHAQGVVHRDLKPENVMLVRRADDPDYVKVLDFGIARLNWGEQSMATAAGLIFGTARYISPEAAQGEKVGPQGDVYSIATMLYQMLAGRTPFDGDQAVALLVQQIHDPPLPVKSVPRAAYVPEPIADVVMQNLAKRPGERADHARAFGRALLEAAVASGLSAQEILARPGMLGAPRGQHPSIVQMQSMQRTHKLALEPDVAARIGAAKTAYEPPADPGEPSHSAVTRYAGEASADHTRPRTRTVLKTEIPDEADEGEEALPPGSITTKWHPPKSFAARLAEGDAEAREAKRSEPSDLGGARGGVALEREARQAKRSEPSPSFGSSRASLERDEAPRARRGKVAPTMMAEPSAPASESEGRRTTTSNVDATMDDQQQLLPPPRSRAPQSQAMRSADPGPKASPATESPPSVSRGAEPPPRSAARFETAVGRDEIPDRAPRTSGRTLGIMAVSCLVGVLGMAAIAYKTGLVGSRHDVDYAALASDAVAHQQWESVRDLTEKGLARTPRDATLLRIRGQASVSVLAAARTKRDGGDAAGALRLAKLAAQLDPNAPEPGSLVEELLEPPTPPVDPLLPPLAGGRATPPASTVASSAGTIVKASIEFSTGQPSVGQPVDFTARVPAGSRSHVEGAAFQIAGPGIAPGTRLDANDRGSGVYRATFTFLQNGRFEVTFTAKADSGPVRSARAIVVGEPRPPAQQPAPQASAAQAPSPSPTQAPPLPPTPPSAEGPVASPSASVRWM